MDASCLKKHPAVRVRSWVHTLKMLSLSCLPRCGAPWTLTSAWALSRWLSACLPEEQFLSHPLCCVLLGTRCARGTLFTTKTKTNKKMEPPDGLGCDPEASADGKTLPCRSDSCCSLGKSPCLSSKMLELVTSRNQTSSRLRWCSLSN